MDVKVFQKIVFLLSKGSDLEMGMGMREKRFRIVKILKYKHISKMILNI